MKPEKKVEMESIPVATDVLVIGGGLGAMKAAAEIGAAGYSVLQIHQADEIGWGTETIQAPQLTQDQKKAFLGVKGAGKVEVKTGTSVCGACGVAGAYQVSMKDQNGAVSTRTFGAIVVATGLGVEPLQDKYGIALSDRIVSLSQFEEMLATAPDILKEKTIAILVGLAQNGNTVLMERVLTDVRKVQTVSGTTVYVYSGDLKVASEGLDRLYREGRDKGAIYIKLTAPPKITSDGAKITHLDPVVRTHIELTPDLVVVEEAITPDPANQDLAALLRIDPAPGGFLQRDNVHFFPVRCNREGIFVVGGAREVKNLSWTAIDASNAVIEIRNLLGDGAKSVPVAKAMVNPNRCTICLTCYRCCPHGAIYWEGDKAVISTVACQGCGICASECPMDAIQLAGFQDEAMLTEVQSAASAKDRPNLVAFCCQNSAFEACEMAAKFGMPLPAGLRTVKVPCAGKVDLEYILSAFAEGADGVLVMTCHTGNCQSDRGNTYAKWRVNDVHRMLDDMGLPKERLRFVTLASNMGPEFSNIVVDMAENIKALKLTSKTV